MMLKTKRFPVLFLSFMLASGAMVQGKTKETIVIKTAIHCDHCLHCNTCGPNIQYAILETKGIRKVKVDPELNTITVTYNPEKTNPDKIKKAISNAGYDADDLKASAEGYSKLDGCCKAK